MSEAGGGESARPPTVDEVVEAIRAMRVGDLLQSTIFTLAQLGFAKLDEPTRDLEQARLAIEALRALLPVAEDALGEDLARDLRQTVTNLQLAYAGAAAPRAAEPQPERQPEPEPGAGPAPAGPSEPEGPSDPEAPSEPEPEAADEARAADEGNAAP